MEVAARGILRKEKHANESTVKNTSQFGTVADHILTSFDATLCLNTVEPCGQVRAAVQRD
jgi:hypothetical protein